MKNRKLKDAYYWDRKLRRLTSVRAIGLTFGLVALLIIDLFSPWWFMTLTGVGILSVLLGALIASRKADIKDEYLDL